METVKKGWQALKKWTPSRREERAGRCKWRRMGPGEYWLECTHKIRKREDMLAGNICPYCKRNIYIYVDDIKEEINDR